MQAILLAFRYLPVTFQTPQDEEARAMMHNAACIAAMAFANAGVGVNHALAHAFGARFGVAHGRANAIMLPHVIAYNASVPTKFRPSPNQRAYVAHHKYARVAELLHLSGTTVEERVVSLVAAVEELLDALAMPRSISALGISQEEFERALPDLVSIAFDDPSWLSNPRMPLMGELEQLLRNAYSGRRTATPARAQQAA
jgi:acetaldehyde dehydrogenase/alcohol dehydrogenase